MKGLDFKDWAKISEDKNSTTLRHSGGHLMTIAHGALPKIQQEQLKRIKMADGGSVKGVHKVDDEDDGGASAAGSYARASKGGQGVKQKFWQDSAKKEHQKVLGEMRGMPAPKLYADSEEPVSEDDSAPVAEQPTQSPLMMPVLPQQPSPMASAPRYTGTGAGQGTGQIQVPEAPVMPAGTANQAIANTNAAGMGTQANVQAELAKQQALINDENLKKQQAIIDQQQQDIQQARTATQRLDQYVQNNPRTVPSIWGDRNAPQKVGTAISLLMGGFYGGFSGTNVNPAMQYLQDQQNKEINAQKDRMDQQNSIYGAYHKLYGDDVIATNLAKNTYNDMYKAQAQQAALRLGTAQAHAQAQILGAKFDADNFNNLGVVGKRMSDLRSGQAKPMNADGSVNRGPHPGISADQERGQGGNQQSVDPDINILTPQAEGIYGQLKFNKQLDEGQKAKISDQYTKVKMAEPVLQAIPGLYDSMANNATAGGHLGRALTPQMAGMLGEAIGPVIGGAAAMGQGIVSKGRDLYADAKEKLGLANHDEPRTPDIQKDRLYSGAQDRIATDFINSLGGKVSEHLVRQIVANNSPENDDAPEVRAARVKNMIKELRQAIPTDALEQAGMAHKRPKAQQ